MAKQKRGLAGPSDVLIGARIRNRRKELGMTLPELASQIGLTYQQLHKYEVGRNRVAAARLPAIGEALQVPVTYLLPSERKNTATLQVQDSVPMRLPAILDRLRTVVEELETLLKSVDADVR